MSQPPRTTAGSPDDDGGRFAATSRPEPDLHLQPDLDGPASQVHPADRLYDEDQYRFAVTSRPEPDIRLIPPGQA